MTGACPLPCPVAFTLIEPPILGTVVPPFPMIGRRLGLNGYFIYPFASARYIISRTWSALSVFSIADYFLEAVVLIEV